MSDLTFDDYANKLFRLYDEGGYADAYDWVTSNMHRFPDESARICFWRVCLASRLNNIPQALQLMEEGLAAGYWFEVEQLRNDSDLEPLQGHPGFERMVEVCRQRQAEAQANVQPALTTLVPSSSSPPYPLLFVLHGHNTQVELFQEKFVAQWRSATAKGLMLAAPLSSQITSSRARGWSDAEKTSQETRTHFESLESRIDPKRVIVGGFSLGAEHSIRFALSGAIPTRGFIAVAQGGPFTSNPERWTPLLETGSARAQRGYLIVGEQDRIVFRGVRAFTELLKQHGIAHQLEVHPNLRHEFPPDFENSLTKAIEFISA